MSRNGSTTINPSKSAFLRFRFLNAYSLVAKVLFSYFALWIIKKILPSKYQQNWTEKTHKKNAQRILNTLLKLKGLFIKIGQMLSMMTTFLPVEWTVSFEKLQDAVPPRPYLDIEKRFLEEFQKKPDELFTEFEKTPIASASLGQVHCAYLKEGQKVAVKVQYPEIEEMVKLDLITIRRIIALLNFLFPYYGLKKIYSEISQMLLQEIDFNQEAIHLEQMRENFKNEEKFLFPKVYPKLSSKRILTLEFMEGVKISQLPLLKELQINQTEVATQIIHAYCKQIFIDGLYHADPHPGNFLVQNGPKIILIDFGAVASISQTMRQGAARFIQGVIHHDNQMISKSLKQMGFISKGSDEEAFDRIVDFFYDQLKDLKIEEMKDLNFKNLGNLEDLINFNSSGIRFKDLFQSFHIPKDWALLERSLVMLMSLIQHLDPNLNPLKIIIPYAETYVLGDGKTLKDFVLEALKDVAVSYLKLPAELHRTLKKLNKGEIELSSQKLTKGEERIASSIEKLTISFIFIVLSILQYLVSLKGEGSHPFIYYAWAISGLLFIVKWLKKS